MNAAVGSLLAPACWAAIPRSVASLVAGGWWLVAMR